MMANTDRGAVDRPWVYPLMTFLACATFFVAVHSARESGIAEGIRQERAIKAEHDKAMKDLGACDWAKLMAKSIQCERQLP